MNKYCENCGSRFYSSGCMNCNESNYIAKQYGDLGICTPKSISDQQLDDKQRDNIHVTNEDHRKVLGLR